MKAVIGPAIDHSKVRKRPADEPQSTQSKRSRYISNACGECRRRKIKCDGGDPCERCQVQLTKCYYRRNPRAQAEIELMAAEMRSMREQFQLVLHKLTLLTMREEISGGAASIPKESNNQSFWPRNSFMSQMDTILPQQGPGLRLHQGPTSFGFAFDIARKNLQAIGLNITEPEPGSAKESLNGYKDIRCPSSNLTLIKKMCMIDPLWNIDKLEIHSLLEHFENGPASLYPVVDVNHLRVKADELHSAMALAKSYENAAVMLSAAEAMFDTQTKILKLVLAVSLTIQACGMSELAQRLFDSIGSVPFNSLWASPSLESITLYALMALLYFHLDDERQAGRATSIAARQCLELGLNQAETFKKQFIDGRDRSIAVKLFWSIYILDKRLCTNLGVPFVIQDSDIDALVPQPGPKDSFFRTTVAFTQIYAIACRQTCHLADQSALFPQDRIEYLDHKVSQWKKQIPTALNLKADELELELELDSILDLQSRRHFFLRVVIQVRENQLRNIIYHPALYSTSRILDNKRYAQVAVDIARESVRFISNLNRTTTFVSRYPVFFKHFLASAFANIVLAVTNAPDIFAPQVCDEFYLVLDIFRDLKIKSTAMRRIWESLRAFEAMGPYIDLHKDHIDSTDSIIDKSAHSRSADCNSGIENKGGPPEFEIPSSFSWHPEGQDEIEPFLDLTSDPFQFSTEEVRDCLSNSFTNIDETCLQLF
ncbi:hypothetical protein F5884DRAFT_402627 [Xylogone sp. PMI_703]|nr:hypothetical protein F5884DRAFT_402627 [Xylogone sp. PMI_703]